MATQFSQFQLAPQLLTTLEQINFTQPTPIQAAAIPVALTGRDLIGCAQTGTGKTAAFSLPMITRLLQSPSATALVLAPTRELAMQIYDVVRRLTASTQLKSAALIGGVPMDRQLKELKKQPHIIVATPGRLMDHVKRKSANLSQVMIVVLDEADRMLDMGFEPQINQIFKHVPKQRQTMLFSATMPPRIRSLAQKYMKNPEQVGSAQANRPASNIRHVLLSVENKAKQDLLVDELNARQGSVLIFVNTKHGTNRVARYLEEYGFDVTRIHGDRTQGQRNKAINGFRSGEYRILVATDVAARGLDVPQIAHVINFDLPKDVDDYIHRIGRTARAGASGEAICLLTPQDRGQWTRISRLYKLGDFPSAAAKAMPVKPQKSGAPRPFTRW